jgi:hypothetical protein
VTAKKEPKKEPTFQDLLVSTAAMAERMFGSDRTAPERPGWRHVAWLCPDCSQLLVMCNRDGHRASGLSMKSDCDTPGDRLLPMYVEA